MWNRAIAAAIMLAGVFLWESSPLPAQTYSTPLPTVNDKDVALLRTNLQAQAKQIITKNMQFTDSEAAAFWPLYDEYAAEESERHTLRAG